jgi:hypothetical protein
MAESMETHGSFCNIHLVNIGCTAFTITKATPSAPELLVARNVLDATEVKYFLSNAPESTSVAVLLRVAFTRWMIERAFEDSKTELGLDHFEVRKFGSIQRHLILSCLSHVFLSEFCLRHLGEKSGPDGVPGPHGHGVAGTVVDAGWTRGGHCSRKYAEQIAAQLTRTQQRRVKAARCHRRRTLARLHALGITLENTIKCHWRRL